MSNMYQKIISAEESLLKLRTVEKVAEDIKNEIFELETMLSGKKTQLTDVKKDILASKDTFDKASSDLPSGITKSKFKKLINSRIDPLLELGLLDEIGSLSITTNSNKDIEKVTEVPVDDTFQAIVDELDESVSYEDEINNMDLDDNTNDEEVDDIPDFLS